MTGRRDRLEVFGLVAFIVSCLAGMVIIWAGPGRHAGAPLPSCHAQTQAEPVLTFRGPVVGSKPGRWHPCTDYPLPPAGRS